MSVSPALTSDERTALLGAGTVRRFLSPVPDVTVATALVNQVTFTYTIAQLTVDTTSNWTSVREGMTVYVGSGADLRDKGTYRVRKAGNSTTLFIEEIGSQNPGQLAMDIRATGIANNDFITVIQRYDMWSVLPRINATSGLITEDFDLAVSARTSTPEALVTITVNGRRNHLFTYIATSTLAITATVSVTKWPTSSGSTLTYAWVYPAGWTSVSGSTSATLTATAAPGNYSLKCTVTDSIGGATERIIVVNIHDDTTNPPLLISEMPRSDVRDRTGRRMSFPLYNNRLASLVDGAMCGYFEVCTWNGVDVPTASRQFVGWIQRHDFSTADSLRDATIELVGPAAILDKMQIVSNVASAATVADTWQKVVPSLASGAFLAWLMLRWRAANTLRLFNFTPFSVAASGQRLPKWQIDKGSALSQIRQIITERGNFGANSEGELLFLNHPSLMDYDTERSAVVTRDTIDASIYKMLSGSRDLPPRVQQVRGEAFSWDGAAVLPIPYYSDAPKAPGQGNTQTKLGSQIVTGQAQLNQLTGDEYARANNPYSQLTILIEKNRDVYEPAEMAFVQATLPTGLNPTGVALVKNLIPVSVNKRHNADLTSDIELVAEAETHGLPGDFVPVPVGNSNNFGSPAAPTPIDIPPLPNFGDLFPIPTQVFPTIPASGEPVIVPGLGAIRNSSTKQYRTYDITAATPVWDDVTPPDAFSEIVMGVMDQGTNFSRGAYCLSTDGTDSVVSYTQDFFATIPVWTTTGMITGICYAIRSTRGVPGEVYCAGNVITLPTNPADSWDIGTFGGGTITSRTDTTITVDSTGPGREQINLMSSGPDDCALTTVEVLSGGYTDFVDWINCGDTQEIGNINFGFLSGQCVNTVLAFTDVTGPFTMRFTFDTDGGCGSITLGPTFSVQSTDFAESFDSPEDFGTVETPSGFDVSRMGLVSYAGDTEQAVNAFGGSYSTETRVGTGLTGTYPISIKIPDMRNGSASLTNISGAASYLFQTADFVSGEAWFKGISTRLPMTPSVGGVKAVGVSTEGIDAWRGKTFMGIGDVDDGGVLRYVFMSRSTGAGWTHTQIDNAIAIRARRLSQVGNQWVLSCGADGLLYTTDWGATWTSKGATECLYAEIFG